MLGASSPVKPTLAIMPTHWHQAFIAAELYSDAWIGIHSESAQESVDLIGQPINFQPIMFRKITDERENILYGRMDRVCCIQTGECCIQLIAILTINNAQERVQTSNFFSFQKSLENMTPRAFFNSERCQNDKILLSR